MKAFFGTRFTIPTGLLILLTLSFGVFIPWLGFYWDDWPVILTGRLLGAPGFWDFYQFDRPFSAWTYVLSFPILGDSPIHWHIFSLLLRWATTAAFWWTFANLWPSHRRQAAWAAFLFAIYPVFTQQSISVAYSQHWISYLLFLLSLGAMVSAWRCHPHHPLRFWFLTALALAASLLQLLTMEYFAGLELLRPFLLWLLFAGRAPSSRGKALLVLRGWLPFLLALLGFTVWRLFFLTFPGQDANPPSLLFHLFSTPLDASLRFLEIALQDTLHLLFGVWASILSPANINLHDRFILFSWAWTFLIAAAAAVFLSRIREPQPNSALVDPAWNRQALLLGGAAILLGMLPVWFTDRQIIVGAYSNRFGLPAMLGTSLVLVAAFEVLIKKRIQRLILISLLIGLAAGAHIRTSNDYRWVRILQNRFFWQLAWRAPDIESGTGIMAYAEVLPRTGLYSTAAGINLLFANPSPTEELPYWFYSLSREFGHRLPELTGGIPLETSFRNFSFHGESNRSLIVYYQPGDANCLRIVTPLDERDPALPDVVSQALPIIDLSVIKTNPDLFHIPDPEIFGPEPEHDWCYLFQKADLARQTGNWMMVSSLADQALKKGFNLQNPQSNTPQEWIPFIEGYARSGRWQEALALSSAVLEREPKMAPRLCSLWSNITPTFHETGEQMDIQNLLDDANCDP